MVPAIASSHLGTPLPTPGAADGSGGAALRTQVAALVAEKAALKQRCAEMQAALAKVQRRGAEQLRLAKKSLAAVREVQAAPRPDLSPAAAAEVRTLRAQLDAAHAAQRAQSALVRKYESRWAQLKASARRKQVLKEQQAAAGHAPAGGAAEEAQRQSAHAEPSPLAGQQPPRRAHFGMMTQSFAPG
jgi:hypothetical protein